MTIVITGATGHLGRHTIESLLERGVPADQIVAGGRDLTKLDDFAARGVKVVPLDYSKPETLDAAFVGAEKVLLISASEPGTRVPLHQAAIDAAKRAGVAHLVYTSAPKATTSELILAPEHKATEEHIAASGIPSTILRNGWYHENYLSTVDEARNTGVVVKSTGGGRVSSASRRDYAEAAAAVLTGSGHDGKVYELSGDTAWDFAEFADVASKLVGRDVTFKDVTPEEHREILAGHGLPEGAIGFVVGLDQNIKSGLLGETSGDLARLIGRPTTPLAEGLA